MSDDDLVTITVRREDIEEAIGGIWYAHANCCVGYCACDATAERIEQAIAEFDRTHKRPRPESGA